MHALSGKDVVEQRAVSHVAMPERDGPCACGQATGLPRLAIVALDPAVKIDLAPLTRRDNIGWQAQRRYEELLEHHRR
jgi:hypothetical protein